jgi:RNA recognition motif-containing protein
MLIEITSLHLNVAETDLQRLFTPFGEISSIEILRDRLNNRSRGKAIINMPVEKQAQQAVASLNGALVLGRPITVTVITSPGANEQKRGLL